jgi:hypothetical protein
MRSATIAASCLAHVHVVGEDEAGLLKETGVYVAAPSLKETGAVGGR